MLTLYNILSLSSGSALITDPTWTFSVVLLIILVAPFLRRLHIPYIAVLILAGIAIGQYGFNIIERDRSFEIFGQVGVYYIMFMAALELDMGSVENYGKRGLQFGALTFFLPFAIGGFLSHWMFGFNAVTSALMGCIYGSHTLVTYPIVGRYGMGKHHMVVVSVVSTAIAMFAALLILAISVGSINPNYNWTYWPFFACKCLLYALVLFFVYPKVGRWFLRRFDDSVGQFIFILVTMSFSAALAMLCGLEGLLGAFLSGLVSSRLIPRTSPLMNRIEFVGNALFIPYFLIGVGMIVNVRVLVTDIHTIWLVAVMVITATVLKFLAAVVQKLLTHSSWDNCILMFGLTSAHSAGALAIVMVATSPQVNLMDGSVINGVVMLILFSCIISSFATSYGARRLAVKETSLEDNRGSFHGKCLVAYSQKDSVEAMTMLAILIRNPYIPDGLMGLSVAYDDGNVDGVDRYNRGKRLLEKAQEIATASDLSMVTLNRISTNIVSGIVHTMKEYDCGEVIVCLADRITGMPKSSLGVVIDNLIEGCHREVMALRSIVPLGTLRCVVVAVPQKAEYEVGFYKWMEHICRIGEQLDCRIEYYAHSDTLPHIERYMVKLHSNVRAGFSKMDHWGQLMNLPSMLGEDEMLVIVTARQGFISYHHELDSLPLQIHRYFSHTSVMLLYPDEWGDPMEDVSIFAPNGRAVTRQGKWLRSLLHLK